MKGSNEKEQINAIRDQRPGNTQGQMQVHSCRGAPEAAAGG